MLLDAAKSIMRRMLDVTPTPYSPGDRCRVRYSVVVNKGTLLRGSLVETTGVQDPKGHYQVKVLSLPDHHWDETSRLPYGPGFMLFIDAVVLEVVS